jgi:hypothetical protein
LREPVAAALSADAGGGLDDALNRQVLGQLAGSALRASPLRLRGLGRRDLGLGLLLGLRLLQILDRQFELFDEELAPLRRLAETLAARPGKQELQPLDLECADLRLVLRLAQRRLFLGQPLALGEDQGVRARQIVRKVVRRAVEGMFARARHAPS